MSEMQLPRNRPFRLKVAGIVFAIYFASFVVFIWMDNARILPQQVAMVVSWFYFPLFALAFLIGVAIDLIGDLTT